MELFVSGAALGEVWSEIAVCVGCLQLPPLPWKWLHSVNLQTRCWGSPDGSLGKEQVSNSVPTVFSPPLLFSFSPDVHLGRQVATIYLAGENGG